MARGVFCGRQWFWPMSVLSTLANGHRRPEHCMPRSMWIAGRKRRPRESPSQILSISACQEGDMTAANSPVDPMQTRGHSSTSRSSLGSGSSICQTGAP